MTCSLNRLDMVSSSRDSYGRMSGAARSDIHARCSLFIDDNSFLDSPNEDKSKSMSIAVVVKNASCRNYLADGQVGNRFLSRATSSATLSHTNVSHRI